MQEQIHELLKRNNLSVTAGREKILALFFEGDGALSHSDIEKRSGEKFDRVTVYRTLTTFVKKGIIHTIPTADNSILYALCKDECEEGHHHDHHVHFLCNNCNQTYCLESVVAPALILPSGYNTQQVNVVVEGRCKQCNNK